ncbi:hypothetical protein R1flu_021835 [Riccia fluitans]|uniref:NB-ARC domain-containing protein n=1 Tax=Riccia fluitans TaxID=41844 RepID=A0ABD1ZRN4_9MARC
MLPEMAPKKLNDAVYEIYRPPSGPISLEIVFFHGFQSPDCREAPVDTRMPVDEPATASENVQRPSSIFNRVISWLVVKRKPLSELEEASARNDMDGFCVVSGDRSLTIHEPKDTRSERTIPVRSEIGAKCEPVPELGEASARHEVDRFCAQEDRRLVIHKPKEIPVRSLAGVKREPETSEVESTEARNQGHSVSREDWSLAIREPVVTESERINPVNLSFGQKRNREESSQAIYNPYDRTSSVYQLLANFLRDILGDVECVKRRWLHILDLPEQFVATSSVEDLIARLRLGEPEPARMSLVGMGGIGKTTLAKAVLLKLRSQFDYVCFIEDLKEKLKKHKELHTLIGNSLYTGAGYKVRMVDEKAIWEHLKGKRVLLIMDNIDDESDIRDLLRPDWVDEGSRFLTTSRVRSAELMPSFTTYDVPFLSDEEPDKLFRRHIRADVVGNIPNDLICKIVDKCDGLPLTIEVIGRYLYREKRVLIWTGAFKRLKEAESINGSVDDKLWAKLRVSFDELSHLEREMFLDLASFDKDESDGLQYELSVWKAIWQAHSSEDSVETCLKNLSDKCFIRGIRGTYGWGTSFVESLRHESCGSLITSDPDSELAKAATFVWIHEQLRDMGRSICRPPGEVASLCRGVWKPDDVDQLSEYPEEHSSSVKTESLVLTESKSTGCGIPSGKRLEKLRLMRLCDIGVDHGQSRLSRLAVLHMVFSPGTLGELTALQELKLCRMGISILPDSIGALENLRTFWLSELDSLESLPDSIGQLKSLKFLRIQKCGTLNRLPETMGQLHALEVFELEDCACLHWSPGSLGEVTNVVLKISGCADVSVA